MKYNVKDPATKAQFDFIEFLINRNEKRITALNGVSGTYAIYNDGVTSGQVTSITVTDGRITAIATIP